MNAVKKLIAMAVGYSAVAYWCGTWNPVKWGAEIAYANDKRTRKNRYLDEVDGYLDDVDAYLGALEEGRWAPAFYPVFGDLGSLTPKERDDLVYANGAADDVFDWFSKFQKPRLRLVREDES